MVSTRAKNKKHHSLIRHDWQQAEVLALLSSPLLSLLDDARAVHCSYHGEDDVQLASLLSIKTGNCPEDCAYCPQSAHYQTHVKPESWLDVETVLAAAQRAKDQGASRFCLGSATRQVVEGRAFESILAMVQGVRALGLEACVTLGMLNRSQAERLARAGLTAYNHNLDSAPSFYETIITTRCYADRLQTLEHVRAAGLQLCCGGIIGMGETLAQRAELLVILSGFEPHPESVPINALVPIDGTPLQDCPPIQPFDMVRMCAVARIMMPQARVRLSAGRRSLSAETQALCFYAGANSIFFGERLLTTENPDCDADKTMLADLGLTTKRPDENASAPLPRQEKENGYDKKKQKVTHKNKVA